MIHFKNGDRLIIKRISRTAYESVLFFPASEHDTQYYNWWKNTEKKTAPGYDWCCHDQGKLNDNAKEKGFSFKEAPVPI